MKLTLQHCNNILFYIVLTLVSGLCVPDARAFAPETYADNSVLASGRWVKVSVSSTGMHLIPAATLTQWGFTAPERVRVYGYGGEQISDALTAGNYVDDLPEAPSEWTPAGLVFYARGPVTWKDNGSRRNHSLNKFSTVGYYFLTDSGSEARGITEAVAASSQSAPQTTFVCGLYHEQDLVSPGNTGHLMCGEDFAYTRSRTFNFALTGYTGASPVTMECSFVYNAHSSGSTLLFTANGHTLPTVSSDRLDATSSSVHARKVVISKSITPETSSLALGITYNSTASTEFARLDYITLSYPRRIELSGGLLNFTATSPSVSLSGASSSTRVWDVTDPRRTIAMKLNQSSDNVTWVNEYSGRRIYAAWNPGAAMPVPVYVGTVANQNLHALSQADMVIFTPAALRQQAERIAAIHRNSATAPLTVHVVDQDEVFNEFACGMADPNAYRRLLKMLYDRPEEPALRYALVMGRGSFDNRAVTSAGQKLGRMRTPLWESEESLDDDASYTTDDVIGFLADNSGINMGVDELSIAVGRIPATTQAEARVAVDKIEEYISSPVTNAWKNRVLLLADDGNSGEHMDQSDKTWKQMLANDDGDRFFYQKIYIDAYQKTSGLYPEARTELMRTLDEGVMLWCYIGHGGPTALTNEGMVTYNDLSTLYLRRYPILYAATCDFLKWDSPATSGAELLHFLEGGGTIVTVSATRPVLITENGRLSKALGSELTKTDGNRFRSIGEIYRRAKNSLGSNTNKLRYVLLGDPALPIAMPDNRVAIKTINGETPDMEAQTTIRANETVTVTGEVMSPDGTVMSDFNGIVSLSLYDAEYSVTSLGNGDDGKPYTFDQTGRLLYTGNAVVTAGEFTLRFAMPSQIAGNFRPATINMAAYATAAGDTRQASGTLRDLYVYGYDDTTSDDTAPVIEYMVLNHESFASGDNVNESPMLIASVHDDRGINLSSAGIGQQMNVTIDGVRSYEDLSRFYTPDADVTDRCAGTVAYPLSELEAGHHTLRLRVWDTTGNMAERSIECNVVPGMAPKIFDIYTDANPARTEARFYITHNRPDARMKVTVTVYNLLGQPVWSSSASGRSDMFTSSPLTWDLTDGSGRRVGRGIYVYRAEISTSDGGDFSTGSRKLAVASN